MSILRKISLFVIFVFLLTSPVQAVRIGMLHSEKDGDPANVFAHTALWPNGSIAISDVGVLTYTPTAGGGDVTSIGPVGATGCVDGACFDGTSDGGQLLLLYDGNSHSGTIDVPDIAGNTVYTLPTTTSTLLGTAGDGGSLTNLDGENIQADSIDDDSIDWADNTCVDMTMTDCGTITSTGVVTGTGFTIGSAVITETELEILDDATLTTTQLEYLNAATGITGTANTNLVYSTSPALTTPNLGAVAAGSTWNLADTITALSVYTGTTSLDETNAAGDNGATLIGVDPTELANCNEFTVQDCLDDLDAAITAANVEDDAYGAGWNGDDTNASSQDALHDYLVQLDADYDGDIDQDSIDGFGGSATPKATLDDTDGADCYWDANAEDAVDAKATFGCDDSTGDDVTYVRLDGVDERIELEKPLETNKSILGGINVSVLTENTYTIGTDNTNEAYGTMFINSDDDALDLTLPSAVLGMSVCVFQGQGTTGAITLQPAAGDFLVIAGARGNVATDYASTGAAGDRICVVAMSATDWIVTSIEGTWGEP